MSGTLVDLAGRPIDTNRRRAAEELRKLADRVEGNDGPDLFGVFLVLQWGDGTTQRGRFIYDGFDLERFVGTLAVEQAIGTRLILQGQARQTAPQG